MHADRAACCPPARRAAALRPPRANDRLGLAGARTMGRHDRDRAVLRRFRQAGQHRRGHDRRRRQHELTRWSNGQGALPEELAAPIWGRYALFRGHPRIVGMVLWNVANREVLSAGKRGDQEFDEVLIARPRTRTPLPWHSDTSPAAEVAPPRPLSRVCVRCGTAIASEARTEATYCSKLCRQAASRARLRERSGRAALRAPAQCAHCSGPIPKGLRPEALYCSRRCRQAASRSRLASRA